MTIKWRHEDPLTGTTLFPHHRRWDCRRAIVEAFRYCKDNKSEANFWLGRATAFNSIMFDCKDPMASRYCIRINKIQQIINS